MSKVVINFDTVTDALDVTVDGESLSDVISISIYRSYDEEYNISISMSEDADIKGGLRKSVYLCAADKSEAKEAQKAGYTVAAVGDGGLVKVDKGETIAARDIADLVKTFGKSRR